MLGGGVAQAATTVDHVEIHPNNIQVTEFLVTTVTLVAVQGDVCTMTEIGGTPSCASQVSLSIDATTAGLDACFLVSSISCPTTYSVPIGGSVDHTISTSVIAVGVVPPPFLAGPASPPCLRSR